MVSGVNCSKCKYGTLLPLHPLDYNSAWECSDCDNIVPNETIATKLTKYEEDIEDMEKNKVDLNKGINVFLHFLSLFKPKIMSCFFSPSFLS